LEANADADDNDFRVLAKENKELRANEARDAKTIREKDNKINDLRACMPLPQSYGITMEVRKDKEIKALHDQMRGLFHQVVEKDKEIKLLREQAVVDAKTISEKANDIEVMAMREESIEIQRVELYNENKELREIIATGWQAQKLREMSKEIKDLRAASDLHRAAWLGVRSCDSCTEMSNEIKELRANVARDGKTIQTLALLLFEKDKEIKDLRANAVSDAETIREKAKEINNLRIDKEVQDGLVSALFKQIRDLR
jgi:hypothetical protein